MNRGTYGAPGLTAAAIEDLKRGDVVGERTFGEGAVQKTIDLPDGAALMLTVAKYEDRQGKRSRTKPSLRMRWWRRRRTTTSPFPPTTATNSSIARSAC